MTSREIWFQYKKLNKYTVYSIHITYTLRPEENNTQHTDKRKIINCETNSRNHFSLFRCGGSWLEGIYRRDLPHWALISMEGQHTDSLQHKKHHMWLTEQLISILSLILSYSILLNIQISCFKCKYYWSYA